MRKVELLCMFLRPSWLKFICTTFLGYIWATTTLSVTPAYKVDEIASKAHSSKELITNQAALKTNLPDLFRVSEKRRIKGEVGNNLRVILSRIVPNQGNADVDINQVSQLISSPITH